MARALAWQARGDRFESGILHGNLQIDCKSDYYNTSSLYLIDFIEKSPLHCYVGLLEKAEVLQPRLFCLYTKATYKNDIVKADLKLQIIYNLISFFTIVLSSNEI